MNLERALAIEGWMNPPELEWLARHAAPCKSIVEVGSWMGRSTRALADNTEGTVFAIDTWNGSEEHKSALADKHPNWLYDVFWENVRSAPNIVAIRGESVKVAARMAAGHCQFDLVFIDASHDYENVKADILAWKPLVKPGGILCGHDRGYGPVYQATTELLGTLGGETDIWCVHL